MMAHHEHAAVLSIADNKDDSDSESDYTTK